MVLFQGLYLPAHAGMPFGEEDQPGFYTMQVHYDNQMETPGNSKPYFNGLKMKLLSIPYLVSIKCILYVLTHFAMVAIPQLLCIPV